MYLLPLDDEMLSLVYTPSRASYATYEPRFEASALVTTDLANPPNAVSMIPAVLSGVAMAVVASLLAARKKKAGAA